MIEQEIVFESAAGGRLSGVLTHPEADLTGYAAVLLHGYGSNRNNGTNRAVSPRLAAAGIPTLRFDFFGHGASEGDIVDLTIGRGVADLQGALGVVKSELGVHPERIGLLGGSYGGNIAVLFAAVQQVAALALKSPISDYAAVRRRQLGQDGIRRWHSDGVTVLSGGIRSRYAFFEEALAVDTYAAAARITSPTLIVQGSCDEDIAPSETERLARCIPDARLLVIDGANHGYSNAEHFERMTTQLAAFLVEHLGAHA